MTEPMRRSLTHIATRVVLPGLLCLHALPARAQEIGDAQRLAGVTAVALRATADWDELITNTAGGATEDQFEEALLKGLQEAIAAAPRAPRAVAGAPDVLECHVDTFYESGLIAYAVRAALLRPGGDGRPVATWLESHVGTYTAQQLHLMWTLADQCADAFLAKWVAANPR